MASSGKAFALRKATTLRQEQAGVACCLPSACFQDTRIISYGIRYVVETYLERRWTLADVQAAAHFYR